MTSVGGESLEDIRKALRTMSLGEKIVYSIYKLNSEIAKIERFLNNLKNREKELYNAVIEAKMRGDEIRASIYASEIVELRKIIRTLEVSKLSLERTLLKLRTIHQLGDIAKAAAQIEPMIRDVKKSLGKVMPEISWELEGVRESLLTAVSEIASYSIEEPSTETPFTMSSEAKSVLEEAKRVAERRVKKKFPKP
ncbi:MAG: hypothetical protein B6U76_11565 [Desulfurococcales archaeon ex4484_217_2]|nr:MAG: hypothetical protein B6U76_11565 [Desulfurococcales archaeon ex4484_217_2]